MDKQTAINLAGGIPALARLLGITPEAIYQWGNTIPSGRLWQIRAMKPEWFDVANKNESEIK